MIYIKELSKYFVEYVKWLKNKVYINCKMDIIGI
jgi:hypothetical protein